MALFNKLYLFYLGRITANTIISTRLACNSSQIKTSSERKLFKLCIFCITNTTNFAVRHISNHKFYIHQIGCYKWKWIDKPLCKYHLYRLLCSFIEDIFISQHIYKIPFRMTNVKFHIPSSQPWKVSNWIEFDRKTNFQLNNYKLLWSHYSK